jgi:hypothetical protein
MKADAAGCRHPGAAPVNLAHLVGSRVDACRVHCLSRTFRDCGLFLGGQSLKASSVHAKETSLVDNKKGNKTRCPKSIGSF